MTVEHVTSSDGGLRVLRARGELDVLGVAPLLEQVPELVRGATSVVLDLSEVSFFDSAGVRLVDRLARSCDRNGAGFRVVAPAGGRARRILDVVGIGDALACESVDDAVAAVRWT